MCFFFQKRKKKFSPLFDLDLSLSLSSAPPLIRFLRSVPIFFFSFFYKCEGESFPTRSNQINSTQTMRC